MIKILVLLPYQKPKLRFILTLQLQSYKLLRFYLLCDNMFIFRMLQGKIIHGKHTINILTKHVKVRRKDQYLAYMVNESCIINNPYCLFQGEGHSSKASSGTIAISLFDGQIWGTKEISPSEYNQLIPLDTKPSIFSNDAQSLETKEEEEPKNIIAVKNKNEEIISNKDYTMMDYRVGNLCYEWQMLFFRNRLSEKFHAFSFFYIFHYLL